MAYIKNYQRFVEEFVMSGSPRPGTIETPVTPALPYQLKFLMNKIIL